MIIGLQRCGLEFTGSREKRKRVGLAPGWFPYAKIPGDPDPKDGFHLSNYQNPRERRVLEFILPILGPE